MIRRLLPFALMATSALPAPAQGTLPIVEQSGWARGGVCYEIFVRSFQDSDGDGVGDLRGLIQKLDYINDGNPATKTDLGATCLWLMPIAQSPSYHGYDVTNYYAVNRDYGTEADFKRLMAAAHQRGIRVLIDLVLNHTAIDHPYFQSALFDSASPYRDYYRWSPTQIRMPNWGPVWHKAETRNEYYFGLFWSGMPDLNLANPNVQAETRKIARYWLKEMGVDGFRLDAVAHFFESGDTVKHAGANHAWLRDFAADVHRIAPRAYTVGEVWDSTGAIVPYYPDQLDSYFIFEIADAVLDAVNKGSKERLVSAVTRAQRDLPPGRWSPFLRNHDQTRAMTDMGGDVGRAKAAATLLLTLPGFPFMYYGEEIGMTGNKPDPRLRTPMQWSLKPSVGFTTGLPWTPLQPDSLTANVQRQSADTASLLSHYRRLIHLRAANPALGSGDFVPLETGAQGALAYLRRTRTSTALVVTNLSDNTAYTGSLSSAANALTPGRYTVTTIFGGDLATSVEVKADGQIVPALVIPKIAPLASMILQLSRRVR